MTITPATRAAFVRALKILSQPTSFAGLAALALLAHISAPQFATYANAIAGVCGFLAIVISDGSNEGKQP